MRSRRLLAVPMALLAVLMLVSAAFAGGWASVTMADPPTDITPGEETTVEMTVLQHGKTPVDWPKLTIVATNADTGAIVRAAASPVSGNVGQYRATLVLPAEGSWAVAYESPELIMEGSASLAVAPAAAPVAPVVAATASDLMVPFIVVITAITLLGLGAAAVMRRRPHPVDQREQPVASRG